MDTEMGPEEVERYQYIDRQKKIRGEAVWGVTQAIDVKKRFLRFYSCHVFTFFNVFCFVNVFLFQNVHWKFHREIKKFEKHFWNYRNELIGLDYIMKVAECRLQSSTLGIAYSDTTAVTIMQKAESVREVVNCNKLKSSLCL